jgi:hypothetical protein
MIGTGGEKLRDDLFENRYQAPKKSKRSGDLNDNCEGWERFVPIVRYVTARVVFHRVFTPTRIVFEKFIIPKTLLCQLKIVLFSFYCYSLSLEMLYEEGISNSEDYRKKQTE